MMAGRESTRQDDERVLDWLWMRDAGATAYAIARHCGVRQYQLVQTTLSSVDRDLSRSERGEQIGRYPFRIGMGGGASR